jgi:hypothetical protein
MRTMTRHLRTWAASLAAVAVGLGAARVADASPSAKLTYLRGAGAEGCPDEAALRRAVAARLGYDVFFPWARRTVVAEIARGPRGFHARLQVVGEDGLVLGTRSLDATSQSCEEVTRALALAISIAVDDFGLDDAPPTPPAIEPPPPSSAPTVPSPVEPPPPAPAAIPAPTPPSTPPHFAVALSPIVSLLVAPGPSVGLEGSFEVRVSQAFSAGVELRADLPAKDSHGQVETHLSTVSLVPCLRAPRPLFVCVVASVGDFHESGVGVSNPQAHDAAFASVGPRVGVELPLGGRFFLRTHVEGAFVLLRHEVDLNGGPAFDLPVFAPSVGVGGGVLF